MDCTGYLWSFRYGDKMPRIVDDFKWASANLVSLYIAGHSGIILTLLDKVYVKV